MLRRMGKQSGESTESFGMHGPYPVYYRPTVSYKLIGFSSSFTTSHSRVNNGHIYRHDTVPCNADVYSNSNVTKSPQHATRCRRTSVARLMQYREHGHHLRSTTTTLSTFHDDNICEMRFSMLCTGSLELTTENCSQ